MNNDRKITVSIGNSRKSMNWVKTETTVSAFYERLRTPVRSTETLAEYVRMAKPKQDDLKDVAGGYVGGVLKGPQRKANNVLSRDLITLDFDNVPANKTDDIIKTLDDMGYSYCIYSTRKHAPNAPRLRVVMPTDRTMTPDEYEPCARRIAANIGIAMADPTTFEINRLMYFATACADSEYVYKAVDAPFVSVEKLLGSYPDWHDITQWPQVPGSFSYAKLAVKQGDPTAKEGVVGAFCRVYDVFRAINELLPGIYEQTDTDPNRYTYTGGSTAGGAVIYEDGKFLYSHHATDPCSGKLVNAFDLVRLHMFGDKDDNAQPDTPNNKLPSYKAMLEYANGNDEVAMEIIKSRQQQAAREFTPPDDDPQSVSPVDENWMLRLKRNTKTGEVKNTIDNALLILENDPRIRGKVGYNAFSGYNEVRSPLPWSLPDEKQRMWADTDSDYLYWWMETEYGLVGRGNIDSALNACFVKWTFDPVQSYIKGLKWDGKPRLDTLFIDYLGAEDTSYTRTVTRKIMTAAIARAMKPGIKFDNMLILCGNQGVGKSSIMQVMAGALPIDGLFNNSIQTFEGKDALEMLRGAWLVVIDELQAFNRSEISTIKQYLSKTSDIYRAAYARNSKEYQRRCVFFGTTNEYDVLKDLTGNRRFWPVDTLKQAPTKRLFIDLPAERDQIWAEARVRWMMGEKLYLTDEQAEAATRMQEEHREKDPLQGQIEEFINRKIPANWRNMTASEKRGYWLSDLKVGNDSDLVNRQTICAAEIMYELMGISLETNDTRLSRRINAILTKLGFSRIATPYNAGKGYGNQRGFLVSHAG